eukprot:Blabericola_migrator_1__13588@NODE_99_length_14373_cov_95_300643_g89_i0_p10_GENE_NODE_99_length_14373_cov_95_300643_g89_i0NODE_99_length_14373_cov_95_300643_g89_i0_p10_ORF_typecomplete_len149_score27_32_NODE_99_length_14373_cov_95_300643_g89_i01031410760
MDDVSSNFHQQSSHHRNHHHHHNRHVDRVTAATSSAVLMKQHKEASPPTKSLRKDPPPPPPPPIYPPPIIAASVIGVLILGGTPNHEQAYVLELLAGHLSEGVPYPGISPPPNALTPPTPAQESPVATPLPEPNPTVPKVVDTADWND